MQEESLIFRIFPLRLSEAMGQKRLLQRDLSTMSGITQSAISKYLTGKGLPRTPELIKLATVLGVSMDWLCGVDDSSFNVDDAATEIATLKAKLQMITSALQAVLDKAKE